MTLSLSNPCDGACFSIGTIAGPDVVQDTIPEVLRARGWSLRQAAAQLGVTREHLSRVLHGHRHSRSLTRRFRELTKLHQP